MTFLQIVKQERFILTNIGKVTLVFPSKLVSEIAIIESQKILKLPFYHSSLTGCIYNNGSIVPLINLADILGITHNINQEKLILICLNEKAEKLTGVGLIVGKILGSKNKEELPPELFTANRENWKLFTPELLPENIWQLQNF